MNAAFRWHSIEPHFWELVKLIEIDLVASSASNYMCNNFIVNASFKAGLFYLQLVDCVMLKIIFFGVSHFVDFVDL